jgi:DNA-binding SARP family transcriptional activator
MELRFGLLGVVEVWAAGRGVDVGPARQRSVLAALSVDVGQVVEVDDLVERVWGVRRQGRERNTLHTYVSRLRVALASVDGARLVRRSGGYVIDAEPTVVDLYDFRGLVTRARTAGGGQQAIELFEQAFDLWRGAPFEGLATPWFTATRAAVEQERVAAELDYHDLMLGCGRHAAVMPSLAARADARPLDERLASQLMLALYRDGLQADALMVYERLRVRLGEELGADPSPALQQRYRQILVADKELTAPPGAARLPAVPRQLPAPPLAFVGREAELAALDAAMNPAEGGTMVVAAVLGSGGVGKTWLALRWANHAAGRFPDGQLYVNLRGFDPGESPVAPAVALRGFLAALGITPESLPTGLDAQVGLYRSLLAARRVLIVLDNARDTAQVLPLLPGGQTCAVLVTSRNRLDALATTHGAAALTLDVVDDPEAERILTKHVGSARVAGEPAAVADLVRYCAGLPLALGIIAARATASPNLPLSMLADELGEASDRLDALDTGELVASLRAALACSYEALDDDTAEVFRLFGLAPGHDLELLAAANLTGLTPGRVRRLLGGLERAHLVQQHAPGRFRMHDLTLLYATELASQAYSTDVQQAAIQRLHSYYLHAADAAALRLYPQKVRSPVTSNTDTAVLPRIESPIAAAAWLIAERGNLVTTIAKAPPAVAARLIDVLRCGFPTARTRTG